MYLDNRQAMAWALVMAMASGGKGYRPQYRRENKQVPQVLFVLWLGYPSLLGMQLGKLPPLYLLCLLQSFVVILAKVMQLDLIGTLIVLGLVLAIAQRPVVQLQEVHQLLP
jgi:hypothetical protein